MQKILWQSLDSLFKLQFWIPGSISLLLTLSYLESVGDCIPHSMNNALMKEVKILRQKLFNFQKK